MIWDLEKISSLITFGVDVTIASHGVERLVDIPHIMDKESQSVRSGDGHVVGVKAVLNIIIDVGFEVGISVFA